MEYFSKISESKTEYNFDAKFWMATSLSIGLGVNKDEERAYNYFKEFDSDMKPKLTIIVINDHVWDWY
ncbi:22013_t:CDS:2 [Racocetra persica]|uniref:22013_t:CDS:1 n=1 Tax=Racocetra persica TaxID=160502 RepID=A0ACA9QPU2_9GLOM|nr:22013_t:CDS:2 [Racocetra persica]